MKYLPLSTDNDVDEDSPKDQGGASARDPLMAPSDADTGGARVHGGGGVRSTLEERECDIDVLPMMLHPECIRHPSLHVVT